MGNVSPETRDTGAHGPENVERERRHGSAEDHKTDIVLGRAHGPIDEGEGGHGQNGQERFLQNPAWLPDETDDARVGACQHGPQKQLGSGLQHDGSSRIKPWPTSSMKTSSRAGSTFLSARILAPALTTCCTTNPMTPSSLSASFNC